MNRQDSENDEVVFTRIEKAEKDATSDLNTAIWNSMLPVEAKAAGAKVVPVTGLGAGGAAAGVPELLVEEGRIRNESDDLPSISTYATVVRVTGDSHVTAQKSKHESISQKTNHGDMERLLCGGCAYLVCSLYPDDLHAMLLVCKTAGVEEHVVHIAYLTDECVRVTLVNGTMDINVGDASQGWVSKTCQKRGDTCTVTRFREIKLGLYDIFTITNIPAPFSGNMFPEGGALKRGRGPEGGVGGSA